MFSNNFIINYFRDSWAELKKVKWPTRTEIINNTIAVIVSAAIATVLVGAIDYGLSVLIQYLVENNR